MSATVSYVRAGPWGRMGSSPCCQLPHLYAPNLYVIDPPGCMARYFSTGEGVDKWEESLRGGGSWLRAAEIVCLCVPVESGVGGCPIKVATSQVWKGSSLLFAEINVHPLLSSCPTFPPVTGLPFAPSSLESLPDEMVGEVSGPGC